jgi:general secretion pathway protein A
MYAEHFGLREPPFALTPDPAYVYLSRHHREALAHLLYGTDENGGFVQLTGEVGTGKTTLVRALLEQGLEQVDIALCLNPRLTVEELLATVCDELGVTYLPEHASLKVLVDALNGHLLRAHAAGRRTVLIIDEAQNLSREVLEQIRLLTNLETTKHKLLRIILVGQPELRQFLARSDLRQLAQRITARYHLSPLDSAETAAYIDHRLRVAGGRDNVFNRGALRAVDRLSGGIPRLINIICDRALLGAYSQNAHRVSTAIVRQAARETLQSQTRGLPKRFTFGWRAFALSVIGLALIGVGRWLPRVDSPPVAALADLSPTVATPPLRTPSPFIAAPLAADTGKTGRALPTAAGRLAPMATTHSTLPLPLPLPLPISEVLPDLAATVGLDALSPMPPDKSTPTSISVPNAASQSLALAPKILAVSPPSAATAVSPLPPTRPSVPPSPISALAPSPEIGNAISLTPPAATLNSPSVPETSPATLAALLDSARNENLNDRLLALWGVPPLQGRAAAFCEQIKTRALRCLSGQGDWDALRRFDHPAVLRLVQKGITIPVLLRALGADQATLEVAGQRVMVPIEQLKPLWTGHYQILWRPQTDQPVIGPGNAGEAVRWLRQRLALANGQPVPEPASETFDADLAKQLRAFQQARGLRPDGIAGGHTLVLLSNLAPMPGTPALGQPRRER